MLARIILIVLLTLSQLQLAHANKECSTLTVFIPPTLAASINTAFIYVNGEKKSRLNNNSKLVIQVDKPGDYVVSMHWIGRGEQFRRKTEKIVIVNCNQSYFVKVNATAILAQKILTIESPEKAIPLVNKIPEYRSKTISLSSDEFTYTDNKPVKEPVQEPEIRKSETTYLNSPKQEQKISSPGKTYALVIGIDEYDDPNIMDLDQPIKDVKLLYEVLTEKYTFDKENVTFLKNPTKNKITQSLDLYFETITENDNLLIFYAGHGHWDEKFQQGYWLASDADHNNRGTWLSNGTIRDYMRGIQAKHSLLIADACFGGGIFKSRAAFSNASIAINQLNKLPSRKAMTSGAMSEVPDKSVFIEYLVKRLHQNKEKYLSAEQLFASFKIAVINNSSNGQVPQFGEVKGTGDEGGDFIFFRK